MRIVRRSLRRLAFPAVLAAAIPGAAEAQPPPCTTPVLDTPAGLICGLQVQAAGKTVSAYLGIPYAKPPVGSLRWQPPQPLAKWTTKLVATEPGAMCPQPVSGCMRTGCPVLPQSEDCLFLNVWAPSGAEAGKLPVMVFIHGGTFITGSGALGLYDSSELAVTGDVIVVTLNYRLGALGGLAHEDLLGADDIVGNFGFRDQILALQWVRKNIAAFGGDPDQVTIFGQSAGAMSVSLHALSSPQSKGLFQAALMESAPLGLAYKSLEDAHVLGDLFLAEVMLKNHCLDMTCVRGVPAEKLVEAQQSMLLEVPVLWEGLRGLLVWTPVIDGSLLVEQPYAAAAEGKLDVPVVLGTNQGEADLFLVPVDWEAYVAGVHVAFGRKAHDVLTQYPVHIVCDPSPCDMGPTAARLLTDYLWTCSNRQVAAYATAEVPTYLYQFTQISSFELYPCDSACTTNVCHGEELPYVFDTASEIGVQFTTAEQGLSELIMGYWTGFAAKGDPNGNSRFEWTSFGAPMNTLLLSETPQIAADPFKKVCKFWDEVGYDLGSPLKLSLAAARQK